MDLAERVYKPAAKSSPCVDSATSYHYMFSAQLRVCPVAGCNSLPLKCLPRHLASAHPTLSQEEVTQLSWKAAVFSLPAGLQRSEAVVRRSKGGKLQLAKKSTGGLREPVNNASARGRRFSKCDGVDTAAAAARDPAGRWGPGEDASDSARATPPRHEARCVTLADKAVQCNRLPPGFLEALDSAAGTCGEDSFTRRPASKISRPQYAKKTTYRNTSRSSRTVTSSATSDELIVKQRSSLTLLRKRVKFAERESPPPAPARQLHSQVADGMPAMLKHGSDDAKKGQDSPPLPSDGATEASEGSNAGQPCEIMCKWGNWDVIFYETPQFLLSPLSPQHSVIVQLSSC